MNDINYIIKNKDWNKFRKEYNDVSFKDMSILYESLCKNGKDQKCYHSNVYEKVFSIFKGNSKVIELGCYKGYLANEMLNKFPNIKSWIGYDIAKLAIKNTIVKDKRYKSYHLKKWFDEIDLDFFDIFISSHTIEHLSWEQVKKTLSKVIDKCKYVVLEIPIPEKGKNWINFNSPHVLTKGRKHLREFMSLHKIIWDGNEKKHWTIIWKIKNE